MRWRWYIFGKDESGQWTAAGGYMTEREADKMGLQFFPDQVFTKRRYNTEDKARAISIFKHELAGQVGIGLALKPMKHI